MEEVPTKLQDTIPNVDISNLNVGQYFIVAFINDQAVKYFPFVKR